MRRKNENPTGATRRIGIETSPHGSLGLVTCMANGAISWRGPLSELEASGPFDAIFCHDDDAEAVRQAVAALRAGA